MENYRDGSEPLQGGLNKGSVPAEFRFNRRTEPGGYPCMPNAIACMARYQQRHRHVPWDRWANGNMVQAYWLWRTHWLSECLNHSPPWYKKATIWKATDAPPLPGL